MQHLPNTQLTYKPPILIRRLHKQEAARGCVATRGELCVEQGIQYVKGNMVSCKAVSARLFGGESSACNAAQSHSQCLCTHSILVL